MGQTRTFAKGTFPYFDNRVANDETGQIRAFEECIITDLLHMVAYGHIGEIRTFTENPIPDFFHLAIDNNRRESCTVECIVFNLSHRVRDDEIGKTAATQERS